jgi:lipoyl(octanoyl) transferase
MTEQLFCTLAVYNDIAPHSAAMNMAVDEVLLGTAAIPCIRFYRWQSPALSFGYFGKFAHVANYAGERDLVRRWTGGGIVFHGDDLTYSIVIPASDPVFAESPMSIYENVHRALVEALNGIGQAAVVAAIGDRGGSGYAMETGVTDPGYSRDRGYSCFANPVRADVMIEGRKIAGAAQRRTRRGLVQQGSIQGITLDTDIAEKFARALSADCGEFKISKEILKRALALAQQKYGTDSWLRKR